MNTTTPRPGASFTAGTRERLSVKIEKADAIAKNLTLDRIRIVEDLTDLGFHSIQFRRDCVVATIDGIPVRLGV